MLRHWFASSAIVVAGILGSSAAPAAEPPAVAAAKVDEMLTRELSTAHGTASPVALVDDEAFLRRVSLDLVGELPTAAELTAFVLDPSSDKRTRAIDGLLADERYGENWARYWRDVIFYRRKEDRALLGTPAAEIYLAGELNRNSGWNDIAAELIAATGDVRENGATALMLSQAGETEDVAAEVSRIFLGVQIQCAQCHDHPYDSWKREQFHEFAAFFPRVDARPTGLGSNNPAERSIMVFSRDFAIRRPQAGGQGREAEHFMPDLENPELQGKVMTPVFFINGQKLALGATDQERRQTLAAWLTSPENPWFAKAMVNRIWAELVGEGFYEPIDDIGPERECSAPETMDYLATAFTEHDYDIKWLYRTVMATELYQRTSQPRRTSEKPPLVANVPQPLRGDQIFNSLINTLGVQGMEPRFGTQTGYGRPASQSGRAQFNGVFGFDPSDRRGDVTGSIGQALVMMNSSFVNGPINGRDQRGVLGQLLRIEDDEDLTVELYLHCLSRQPSQEEVRECLAYVKEVGDRTAAFEDLFWALLNSTEFLYRN